MCCPAGDVRTCCCCVPAKCAYGSASTIGIAVAIIGALALIAVSIQGGGNIMGKIRNFTNQLATKAGTAPNLIPIFVTAFGGALAIAGGLGLGYECHKAKNDYNLI